jgi:hypothetical protein
MHRRHHHPHDHGDHDHTHQDHHDHPHHGPGHNHAHVPKAVTQWQTPHLAEPPSVEQEPGAPDIDLVEAAFIDGFRTTNDPTSFLRLAHVPFEARTAEGIKLALLRVETEEIADVGAVMPHFGGETFRYDPLPASLVARRRRLRFIYFDGKDLRPLNLAEVSALGEL